MFSIPSISKLIVLIAIGVAVWYGFKYLTRLRDERGEGRTPVRGGQRPADPAARTGAGKRSANQGDDAEDLVKCPVCDAYVSARHASPCGRERCPQG